MSAAAGSHAPSLHPSVSSKGSGAPSGEPGEEVPPGTSSSNVPSFLMDGKAETVVAHSSDPASPSDAAERVSVVGALPFSGSEAPYLLAPRPWWRLPGHSLTDMSPRDIGPPLRVTIQEDSGPGGYADVVARALSAIEDPESEISKVVLARRVVVASEEPIDPMRVLARLRRDPGVTVFLLTLPSEQGDPPRYFVGASPELLVEKQGLRVTSRPLAGSAARSPDPVEDREAAKALLTSEKDRREHAIVVEHIKDTLAPYCRSLRADPSPTLARTASMWHLATRVEGELIDQEASSLELAQALHPTPAICGSPTPVARAMVRAVEPFDRGFYGGAVGWSDDHGDGRWVLAIRCAELQGTRATVFAGAGVVLGSTPEAEVAETTAKFRAALEALGCDQEPE